LIRHLNIHDFLEQSAGHLTLDVRSEGEYNYGHILHATNLPLFDNEERKIIGTAYKQQGKNEAILLGLDYAGKKMSALVRFAQGKTPDNKVFVHCWRGGMRSGSMAWLFNLFGYDVYVLSGGYKAYRHFVLQQIAQKFKLIVIGGKTGSGKTEVLLKLKEMGEQVINLEGLANHKGSAFGALGLPPQPSSEHFENLLANEIKNFDLNRVVWIEDESKTIGRVMLDLNLWHNLRSSPVFVIDLPQEVRIQRLVKDYGGQEAEGLEQAITNIKRRLGNEQWKSAIDAVHAGDFAGAAKTTLYYYDKAYEKGLMMKDTKEIFKFVFETDDIAAIAEVLIKAGKEKGYGN
jgi:tRNA 2-selenouridine synthase